MSSSTTQVFVPCLVQPGDGEVARTEDEEPHRQLAHSTPSSPEQSPATQHQFVIFIVFTTSPAQPPSSPLSPASVEVELTWGPATHLHKHHGHGSRGLVTSRQDTSSTTTVSAAVLLIDQSSVEEASEDAGMPIMHAGL